MPTQRQIDVELPWPLKVGDLVGQDITITDGDADDTSGERLSVSRVYRVEAAKPIEDKPGWISARLREVPQ